MITRAALRNSLALVSLALIGGGGVTGGALRAQDTAGNRSSVEVSAEGREVYEQICQACHMADAKGSGTAGGAGGVIPALANNPKLADKTYPITMLLKGRGGMPWMTDILTPDQMAAVLTYVRGHFNAYTDPVTVADIRRVSTAPPPVRDCDTCGK
jgi:mono/diheme cytochrome c family protein